MTTKIKARDLGLDDLRHDVEFKANVGARDTERVVGQLHAIEGPYLQMNIGSSQTVVRLTVGPAANPSKFIVGEEQVVTVNRDPQRPSIGHFGTGA